MYYKFDLNPFLTKVSLIERSAGRHICIRCVGYSTDSDLEFVNHLSENHPEVEKINCLYCSIYIESDIFVEHVNAHFDMEEWSKCACKECGLLTSVESMTSVIEHLIACHGKSILCPGCNQAFQEMEYLDLHLGDTVRTIYHCNIEGCKVKTHLAEEFLDHTLVSGHNGRFHSKEFILTCSYHFEDVDETEPLKFIIPNDIIAFISNSKKIQIKKENLEGSIEEFVEENTLINIEEYTEKEREEIIEEDKLENEIGNVEEEIEKNKEENINIDLFENKEKEIEKNISIGVFENKDDDIEKNEDQNIKIHIMKNEEVNLDENIQNIRTNLEKDIVEMVKNNIGENVKSNISEKVENIREKIERYVEENKEVNLDVNKTKGVSETVEESVDDNIELILVQGSSVDERTGISVQENTFQESSFKSTRKRKKKKLDDYDYDSDEMEKPIPSRVSSSNKIVRKKSRIYERDFEVESTFSLTYSEKAVKKCLETDSYIFSEELRTKLQKLKSLRVGKSLINGMDHYVCMACNYKSIYNLRVIKIHMMATHCQIDYVVVKKFVMVVTRQNEHEESKESEESVRKYESEEHEDEETEDDDEEYKEEEEVEVKEVGVHRNIVEVNMDESDSYNEGRAVKVRRYPSITNIDTTYPINFSEAAFQTYISDKSARVVSYMSHKKEELKLYRIGVKEIDGVRYLICMKCFYKSSYNDCDIKKHILAIHLLICRALVPDVGKLLRRDAVQVSKNLQKSIKRKATPRRVSVNSLEYEYPEYEGPRIKRKKRDYKMHVRDFEVTSTYSMTYYKEGLMEYFKNNSFEFLDDLGSKVDRFKGLIVGETNIDNVHYKVCMICNYKTNHSLRDLKKHLLAIHCEVDHAWVSDCIRFTRVQGEDRDLDRVNRKTMSISQEDGNSSKNNISEVIEIIDSDSEDDDNDGEEEKENICEL